ncbi:MAG: hypothetical protein KF763_20015 [Cyclobacteriaceae bacterium]|nr:hypothetical protein [Cyclobacteriaceae bacterium]
MMRTLLLYLTACTITFSQQKHPLAVAFNNYSYQNLQEKIFIHTDKNFWVAGETSWFKIYLVHGQSHEPVNSSRVAYVELIGSENQIILQTKVELTNGFGNGYINIPPSISSGNYYLRAYTRWMQNYSAEFYYHQSVTIVNTFRRLFDDVVHKSPDIDIQFFPEGGQWIDGIPHKLAFRAIDQNGTGIDFKGALINSKGDTLLHFSPQKFGIGFLEMIPSTNEDYTAIIRHQSKVIRTKLPPVKTTGFALQVADSLGLFQVTIKAKGIYDQPLSLLAHTRHHVKAVFTNRLNNGISEFKIAHSELEAGISHITLFDALGQPVCDRLIFKKPDSTALQVSTDKAQTSTRKKIVINMQSPNAHVSNLSVSVTRHDSLSQFLQPDIVSYLLLTSDLKGTIESPHYYITASAKAIDNLMLTHGWSRFTWPDVAEPIPVQYLPEYRSHLIEATVTDKQTHAPLPGVIAYVGAANKKIELAGGITNKNGLLLVEANYLKGPHKLILQSPYAQAKIEVKSPFASDFVKLHLPAITLTEKNATALINRSISMQVTDAFAKPVDTVLKQDSSAFYGTAPETYLLDNYTRFPIMEEVMREYVKSVWVRKKGDQFVFKLVDRNKGNLLDGESLVLLDGVPVLNLNDIMAFDPLKIKQLDIIPGRYFVGSLAFDGIVSYRTYKGDLGGFAFSTEPVMIDYEGLQRTKEFYSPRYETVSEINSRIPDGRHLLYWNPYVQINGSKATQLEFYTSDQPGTYQVIVQGLAVNGTPLFGETTFQVVR